MRSTGSSTKRPRVPLVSASRVLLWASLTLLLSACIDGAVVEGSVDDAFAQEFYSSKATDISLSSNSAKGPKRNFKGDRYGKCATITVDEENNMKTVFFDGDCFGKRGQTRTGTIVISYSETKGEIGSFRQVEFDNYFLNDVQISFHN